MIESITVNKWKAESKIEAIRGILEDRFGPLPAEVKSTLEQTKSLDVLQRWVILAAKASSLDEFRRTAGV